MQLKNARWHPGQTELMTTNPALRQRGRRELGQPSRLVRREHRRRSASHDTKARLQPGLHLFVPRPLLRRALYDGDAVYVNFSAELAGAPWVNGSPVKPAEVGLGYAGGNTRVGGFLCAPASLRNH
jgi:hypothetical protein